MGFAVIVKMARHDFRVVFDFDNPLILAVKRFLVSLLREEQPHLVAL